MDTGFTGEVALTREIIDQLGLVRSGSIDGILADGSQIVFETYSCRISWFDEERDLEVIANDGDVPLLGVGLLGGKDLRINYANLNLSLQPASQD